MDQTPLTPFALRFNIGSLKLLRDLLFPEIIN